MKKHSLSIAAFFSTFFSPCIFSANLLVDYKDQKEGSCSTQPSSQVLQPKQVCDYTILNHKNINHTPDDIEEIDEDLGDNLLAINAKLVTTNNQPSPLLLGAVLQHQQNHDRHQYLITNTGLLSEATQSNAVKKAHKKGFHLIKATPQHVILQLFAWLQVSQHYTVIALRTNKPVCRHCHLIANNLWKQKLKTNKKGCLSMTFPLLDKMPNLAKQYINTHLNLSLVKSLVIPMLGYVSIEKMQKAIRKKDNQLDEKNDHIQMLNKEVNKKDKQLNNKNNTISSLTNVIKDKEQIIAELQYILQNMPKKTLDDEAKKKLFYAVRKNEVSEVETFLLTYKDVVTAIQYRRTLFLYAAEEGRLEIAKLLRERRANINAKDEYNRNALHWACLSGSVEMTNWLLNECKIPIETKGQYQKTPFLCAAEKGQLLIAKLLKERSANINAKDEYGDNALHWACLFSGSVEMVTWLLDVCKIDIESKTGNNKTPFICAAQNGMLEIAKLLKQRGANIHVKSESGNNALWWAKMYDRREMISYLQSLGLE